MSAVGQVVANEIIWEDTLENVQMGIQFAGEELEFEVLFEQPEQLAAWTYLIDLSDPEGTSAETVNSRFLTLPLLRAAVTSQAIASFTCIVIYGIKNRYTAEFFGDPASSFSVRFFPPKEDKGSPGSV